ncbi:agmatine coumaroyltransferase-2-like [Euphorbia lathyris]|uniref:agmatine coumaroyltransferase-2-like n=1 Tax=Euphorbia lathyris TaxID=212925 RepID=UPI0033137F27
MKIKIESTRIIKPIHEGIHQIPKFPHSIPLSVFDKVTYNTHIAVIYAYRPPTPPNETIEYGLRRALSEYREWGGRLGENENGDLLILLNDKGVKFVEATVDSKLDQLILLKPSPILLNLHPSLKDVEELVQVQLTRFACGSLVVGFTAHHLVADGHATSDFLVAWGKASRGLDIDPLPIHDRTIFSPRKPPSFEFEHRGVEFKSKNVIKDQFNYFDDRIFEDDISVHKVHFTLDFLSKLKARASVSLENKSYSTFESLVAHLWRKITKARGLGGFEKTHVRISVDGRMRMSPRIPNEYFGNLVLWAFPTARVKDLLREPVSYAAKLIHDAIVNVNDSYFKSFIDFATYKVGKEDLTPTAEMNKSILCPNLEVDSWLRFPFYDLDFGGGCPYAFIPSYFPTEGMMFFLPSFIGDGSIDAFVPLFHDNLIIFKQIVYSLD